MHVTPMRRAINKTYYASSYQQIWVNPGSERTITFRVQYRFM